MKKLLIEEPIPANTVFLNSVTDRFYFGIKNRETEETGLVVREGYADIDEQGYNYRALCSTSITKGNSWDTFDHPNFNCFMTDLLSTFDIFVFDTPQELFSWLGKN